MNKHDKSNIKDKWRKLKLKWLINEPVSTMAFITIAYGSALLYILWSD